MRDAERTYNRDFGPFSHRFSTEMTNAAYNNYLPNPTYEETRDIVSGKIKEYNHEANISHPKSTSFW